MCIACVVNNDNELSSVIHNLIQDGIDVIEYKSLNDIIDMSNVDAIIMTASNIHEYNEHKHDTDIPIILITENKDCHCWTKLPPIVYWMHKPINRNELVDIIRRAARTGKSLKTIFTASSKIEEFIVKNTGISTETRTYDAV